MANKKYDDDKRSFIEKFKDKNEVDARRNLLEEMFNDFYGGRRKIYLMNFIRGIFFGFGSVLGGTVLVAIVIWVLSQTVDFVPALSGFLDGIVNSMKTQ